MRTTLIICLATQNYGVHGQRGANDWLAINSVFNEEEEKISLIFHSSCFLGSEEYYRGNNENIRTWFCSMFCIADIFRWCCLSLRFTQPHWLCNTGYCVDISVCLLEWSWHSQTGALSLWHIGYGVRYAWAGQLLSAKAALITSSA